MQKILLLFSTAVLAGYLPRAATLDVTAVEASHVNLAAPDELTLPGAPGSNALLLESDKQNDKFMTVLRGWTSRWGSRLPGWIQSPQASTAFLSGVHGAPENTALLQQGSSAGLLDTASLVRPGSVGDHNSPAALKLQEKVFYIVIFVIALILILGYARIFYARSRGLKSGEGTIAFLAPEEDDEGSDKADDTDKKKGHAVVSTDDLVDDCGLSGMVVLPADERSGLTNLRYRHAVPIIAIQATALQMGLLWFLVTCLIPRPADSAASTLPVSIVFIAIYLHFLNCTQELPQVWQLFQHFHDFHKDTSDLIVLGGVLMLDAFIVPVLSFFLGALYLCTSRTIGDVILNAVAVAFVHDVDNWILALHTRLNFISGKEACQIAHIPINPVAMRRFAWCIIFIPVVPSLASASFIYIGFHYCGL